MASVAQISGQYMHPVIDKNTPTPDPWQRNYFQPPPFSNLVPRSFPLASIRPFLEKTDYTPLELLKSHGFGIVKHRSALLEKLAADSEVTAQHVSEIYHPELRDLVLKITGAKDVFIMASIFRRGQSAPQEYKMPTMLKPVESSRPAGENGESATANKPETPDSNQNPAKRRLSMAAPVRIPHLDFTPLGARQTIRFQKQDINETATARGVIAAEDAICAKHGLKADSKDADAAIAGEYNKSSAPRYAAYSIWRPLKTVQRDPLTLAPRRQESESTWSGMVYWPYENKAPGPPELKGDWLKEHAMLGVSEAEDSGNKPVKWYYLPNHEPDEVLFIKLFDSASLGEGSEHAGAPWHASPEIGSVHGDEPRESIDVRVLVFW